MRCRAMRLPRKASALRFPSCATTTICRTRRPSRRLTRSWRRLWRTEINEVENVSALHTSADYARLLRKIPPKVIRSERENEYYVEALYELDQRKSLSREERELADLLTLLIEDFEERKYSLPRATPTEMLAFLMDQHSL